MLKYSDIRLTALNTGNVVNAELEFVTIESIENTKLHSATVLHKTHRAHRHQF